MSALRLRRALRAAGALLVLSSLPATPPAVAEDPAFGGYEVVSNGAGFTVAPRVPAVLPMETPVEATLALALATLSSGGLGYGLASSAYPGTPITGIRPLLEIGAGMALPIPDYPFLVESREHEPARSSRQPGVNMTSDVAPERAHVTSDLGGFTIPGLVDIGSVRTTSVSTIGAGVASAQTTTEVNGIDVAGGALHIDTIETVASAATDGDTATCDGGVVVSGASVGDTPVTIDESGVVAGGERTVPLTEPDEAVRAALESSGVEIRMLGGGESCDGASADRTTSGVLISLPLPSVGAVPPGGRLDIVLGATSARAQVTEAFSPDPISPSPANIPDPPTFGDVVAAVPGPAGDDVGLAPVTAAGGDAPPPGPGSRPVLASSADDPYRFGGVPAGLAAGLMLLAIPGARRIRRYVDRIAALAAGP